MKSALLLNPIAIKNWESPQRTLQFIIHRQIRLGYSTTTVPRFASTNYRQNYFDFWQIKKPWSKPFNAVKTLVTAFYIIQFLPEITNKSVNRQKYQYHRQNDHEIPLKSAAYLKSASAIHLFHILVKAPAVFAGAEKA